MFSDPLSPWMFRRDEIDLLEEDVDDLYDIHQSNDNRVETMEQMLIEEQLDTEEQAEAEFEHHMDVNWLLSGSAEKHFGISNKDPLDDDQDLSCDSYRPPFYEPLFLFVDEVFAYATRVHAKGGSTAELAFRVRINIKLVPIKCAIAVSEEMRDDPMSLAVAKKEYKLALVYLDRVLISLAFLAAEGDAYAQVFLAPGTKLKQIIMQNASRLNHRPRGFLQGYD